MILAIIQARTTSTRLPGKVLLPIVDRPMILLQAERILRSRRIGKLLIATSRESSDDQLAAICEEAGVPVFRGSLNDVLDRFYQAAATASPDYVVRLTGDCPLADSRLIDAVIEYCLVNRFDYASNTIEPTYPDGLDVEVMTFEALKTAWSDAALPSQREHVTPFIYQHPERFSIGSYKGPANLSSLRWTVDEPDDYRFVKAVYENLYPRNQAFSTDDVVRLLETMPELRELNSQFRRNEGYQASLAKDDARSRH